MSFSMIQVAMGCICMCGIASMAYSFVGVVQHVRSLSWVQVNATLDDLYEQRQTDFYSDDPRRPVSLGVSKLSKFVARYHYVFQNKTYAGERLSFYNQKSYQLGGDLWWQDIVGRVADNEGQFLLWVNPNQPSESVVVRDIRWFAVGAYFLFGLFLFSFFGSLCFKDHIDRHQGGQVSVPMLIVISVLGISCALLSPLLARDKHYVWATLALLPLLIAIHGGLVLWQKRYFL